jgi:hypothetical protein
LIPTCTHCHCVTCFQLPTCMSLYFHRVPVANCSQAISATQLLFGKFKSPV